MATDILLRGLAVEHVVLTGDRIQSRRSVLRRPLTQRMPPRHTTRDRFAAWRLRIRAAELSRFYERLPLLGGFRQGGAP
jgi:hypothetical protein